MRHGLTLFLVPLLAVACSAPAPADTLVFVSPDQEAVARAFVAQLPDALGADVRVAADPAASMAASSEGERRVALVVEPGMCEGCYQLSGSSSADVTVHGDAPLGIQYGLAHWLEAMGVRFFHPSQTFVPASLTPIPEDVFGVMHRPEIGERGLQLHVLHPIESYFDFWEPGVDNFADAERTLHWLVCNRGNFVTIPALNNITVEAARLPWREHIAAVLDAAHLRGIRVGLGVQLFGRSSLQRALVLVPDDTADVASQVSERLNVLDGLPFDSFNLAFGEFFGAEPDAFIHTVEVAYDQLNARWPDAEVTATVHVGDFPDTRVTYMGQAQLYYFLVRYVDRPVVPWVHTVMYYTLFEPAGGAYNHDDFSEHRDYLLSEIAASRPVGYHPETAYWIAFDNSLPMYLPLYVRSRWYDLDQIRQANAAGPSLQSHVVFSSGWEWGYWQNDVAVLRTSYELPPSDDAIFEEMFVPVPGGAELARVASELADLLHQGLMEQGLAAYLASTDFTFALGLSMDFWSQPRRPSFEEVLAMDAAALDAFETDVVAPLMAFADELEALRDGMEEVADDPFARELRDGVEIDVARARFASAVWSVALTAARGEPIDGLLAEARAAQAEAASIVARRHAALLDRDGSNLIARRVSTAGLYGYGYLREADTQCFYARELAELQNAALAMSVTVPGCTL